MDADMEEIIMSGSVAAASYPGFHAQEDTMDTTGDMDDELDDAKEELEPAPARKGKKKERGANARTGEPRVKWTSKEDEYLVEPKRRHVLDDNKRAKTAKDAALAAERLQSSISGTH